jgi:MFS family permease
VTHSAPSDNADAATAKTAADAHDDLVDSPYAWFRLGVCLLMMTLGNLGMWVVPVIIPAVQAEFGVSRAESALPYTLLMIGFGVGGIFMGRMADKYGLFRPLVAAACAMGLGFVLASISTSILGFALAHGVLIGLLGSSIAFAPLMADTALWFAKRRGVAVAICASGNYLSGTIWPPVMQHFVETLGWRQAYMGVGLFCAVCMLLLAPLLRRRPAAVVIMPGVGADTQARELPFGLSPTGATVLLCVAGFSCCVAMAMPQVHIVAYCADLGYGAALGAEMLSLMLACGIVSRLVSGVIGDRIGALRTLLLGSVLQATALLMFLPFDGLVSLYLVSALFGLFQGGIVPSYTLIVRENFAPTQIGARVGTVIMFTMLGMATGGWVSGKVFDLTSSYHAAFLNGVAWNMLNVGIVVFLLRSRRAK